MFFVCDFHSDDTYDLGDALKCVTVAVPMHCDVAFFPILTITAMIQITLAMLSKVCLLFIASIHSQAACAHVMSLCVDTLYAP